MNFCEPQRQKAISSALLALLVATLFGRAARADVKPNPLFADGAVLQRGNAVPIWGTAGPNEKVTVRLDGQTKTAVADAGGAWQTKLDPMQAGGPFEMTVSGGNTVTFKDVMVGEVWVAAGQSNMEFPLRLAKGGAAEAAAANDADLRVFTVQRATAYEPAREAKGEWRPANPSNAPSFSAVGYYFARELRRKLNVPVGVIVSSWGGTNGEAWASRESLDNDPELKGDPKMASPRRPAPAAPGASEKEREVAARPPGQNTPASLYNGMIAPLVPYGMRGVIWYQGENNGLVQRHALKYYRIFPAIISGWRKVWGQGDFPFLFVQIAPYRNIVPELREAQFLALQKAPSTAMVVTTDVGDANNIHPPAKQPVGERLALAARAVAYGEKMEYSGPLFSSMKIVDGRALLAFNHASSGLDAKGGPLRGFTVAGTDKNFVPARAEINGREVVVWSDEIKQPVAVRYGWSNAPDVNLFNGEGLPASPFRTDTDAMN